MDELNKLPQAISHKKLSFLLLNAQKDNFASLEGNETYYDEQDELIKELDNWESSTKSLLKKISKKNEKYLKENSSSSLMALGAMEVHLNMALQALQAFRRDN